MGLVLIFVNLHPSAADCDTEIGRAPYSIPAISNTAGGARFRVGQFSGDETRAHADADCSG